MVEFWEHKHELASLVVTSLTMAIAIHDKAVGWVRADKIDNTQLLTELNEVRKQKEELESKLAKAVSHPHIDDLAGLYDNISLHGYYESNHRRHGWRCEVPWADVFAAIAPYLFDSRKEDAVRTLLEQSLPSWIEPTVRFPKLDSQVFQTIKIQLMAHNLVDVSPVRGNAAGRFVLDAHPEGEGTSHGTPDGQGAAPPEVDEQKAPEARREGIDLDSSPASD